MYDDGEKVVQRILAILDACPEPLRPKAFELLLQGYVSSVVARLRPSPPPAPSKPAPRETTDWAAALPAEIQPRMQALAKRRGISLERLAALFDFSVDPFAFAPLHVAGDNIAERTRKVALLVAARSFLATGRWVADWAEIKSMSTHQNCYDLTNFAQTLRKGKGNIFKSAEVGTGVELSAQGQEQAEQLLTDLAQGDAASK